MSGYDLHLRSRTFDANGRQLMRKFSYREHWKLGEVDTGAGATMLENFGMYQEGIII